MGDVGHVWPPLIYWPKWKFPKHPRGARAPGAILLWRNPIAIAVVSEHLAPIVPPITWRAMQILRENRDGASLERAVICERPMLGLECAPPPP
jgi:hypothetical protein